MLVARDAGNRENFNRLFTLMLDQMHYSTTGFATLDKSELDPDMRLLEYSNHTLWVAICKRVEMLSDGFLKIAKRPLTKNDVLEKSLVCFHNFVLSVLDGSFKICANRQYISAIQNKITYNGCKMESLIDDDYETYAIKYRKETLVYDENGNFKGVKKDDIKGRAVMDRLPSEEERADLYLVSAIPGIAIEAEESARERGIRLFSDIVIVAAKQKLLVTKEMRDAFCDYCERGDSALREENAPNAEYVQTVKKLKSNFHNRADGTIGKIKKGVAACSDFDNLKDHMFSYLDAVKVSHGGIKRLISFAARECSSDIFTECFGERELGKYIPEY